MRRYNIDEGLMTLLESLYGPSTSAVLHEGEVGQSFRTSVGVRQGCLLSPVLLNLCLEDIMQEALHNFNDTISINGREISNLRFADDIDFGSMEQLERWKGERVLMEWKQVQKRARSWSTAE